jgi:hypothetical protein
MRLQVKVGNQYRIFRNIDPDQFVMYHRQGERTSFSLVAYDNPALVDEPEIATMGAWEAVLSVRGAVHQIGRLRCSPSQHGDSHEFSGVVYSSVTDHRGQERPPTEEELQRAEAAIERVTTANGNALSATVSNGSITSDVNTESILRTMEEAQQRLMNSSGNAIGGYWQGGSPVFVRGYQELRSLQEQESIEAGMRLLIERARSRGDSMLEVIDDVAVQFPMQPALSTHGHAGNLVRVNDEVIGGSFSFTHGSVSQNTQAQATPLTEYRLPSVSFQPRTGRFHTNSHGLIAITKGTGFNPHVWVIEVAQQGEMFEITGASTMFNEIKEGDPIPLYDIHFEGLKLINKGIIKEETYARSIEL